MRITLYYSLIAVSSLDLTYLEKGIGLYGGLFHSTSNTQIFLIFIISTIILYLISFYPRKVWIKEFSSRYKILICKYFPPKPQGFVCLPLQSTLSRLFLKKIFKFFLNLIKSFFLTVVKNIQFSTNGYVVSYKGINIFLNPFIFRLIYFTCLCFSLYFVYTYVNTIINEIVQDPFV